MEEVTKEFPRSTSEGAWKLSENLPTEKAEEVEPEDPLVRESTVPGKAGNGRDPLYLPI